MRSASPVRSYDSWSPSVSVESAGFSRRRHADWTTLIARWAVTVRRNAAEFLTSARSVRCQRSRVVALAGDEQQGSAVGVPGVDLVLGPGVQVGQGRLP